MPGRSCRCTVPAVVPVVRVWAPGAGRGGPAPSEWEDKLRRAEEELSNAEENTHQYQTAARNKRRAEAFLEILRGDSSSS